MKKPGIRCIKTRRRTPPVKGKQNVARNLRSNSGTNSDHLCDVCGKAYKTQAGLNQHRGTHAKVLRCEHCHLSFKSNQCFKQHQGYAKKFSPHAHPVNAKKLICSNCKKCRPCRELLKNHIKCQSTRAKYPCSVCQKQCTSLKDVKAHQKIHKTEESSSEQDKEVICDKMKLRKQDDHKSALLCEVCGKSLGSVKGLQWHRKTHEDTTVKTKEYKCEECNKVFRTPSCLKLHDINHHGAKSLFPCKVCDKHFLNNSRLMEHVRISHTGEKIFNCPRCQKGFTCSRYLKRHLLEPSCSPQEKYKCSECNKLCKSKYSLMYHVNTFHGNRPFRCKYCERGYATKENWQKHEAAHNGVYGTIPKKKVIKKDTLDFMCEQCGKAYGNKHLLARHQLLHTGEKPHICAICSKSFRCKSTLTEHERIHSGEKPFFCEHCGTRFRLSGHLRYHLKALHKVKDVGRLKKINPGKGYLDHVDDQKLKVESKEGICKIDGKEKDINVLSSKKQSIPEIVSDVRTSEDQTLLDPSMGCDKIDNLQPLVPSGEVTMPDGGRAEELLNMLMQGSWLHGGGDSQDERTREDPFRDQFLPNQLYPSQYLQPTYDGRSVGDKSYIYPDQGSDRSYVFGSVSFSQQFPGHSLQQMLFDPPQSKMNSYACGSHQKKGIYENGSIQQIPYNGPTQGQGLNYEMISQRQEFPSGLTSEVPATSGEKDPQDHHGQALSYGITQRHEHVDFQLISELPSTSGNKDLDQQDCQGQGGYETLQRQQTAYPSGLTTSTADKGLQYHGQSVSYGTPHNEEQAILSHVMTSDLGTTSGHANVDHQSQDTHYGGLKEQDQTFYLSVITSELPPTSGDKDLQSPEAVYGTQKRQHEAPLANIVASEVLSTPGDKDGEIYIPQYKELETRTIHHSNKTHSYQARFVTGTASQSGSIEDEIIRSKVRGDDDILRTNATQGLINSSTRIKASDVQSNIPFEGVHKQQDPNSNAHDFSVHHLDLAKDLQVASNNSGNSDAIDTLTGNESKECKNMSVNELISSTDSSTQQSTTSVVNSASSGDRKISDLIQCLEDSHELEIADGRKNTTNDKSIDVYKTPRNSTNLILEESATGIDKFCCTTCDIIFKSEDDLNTHA
ncbi:uncharacterized protein [Amphiura filiformis]|uniref:uncharacterized protein n=1 Tax=Amphiura filiformis TaxID=82378 RepID=UPI003B20D53E